ncbi:MAG: SprB repeat-containing protein [Sphingobacteriales bacterium JAD_PAG50586_3]|nr:MAG: SprB repeat-containing protein [Sphingobacteriales bacterium JAD_PAG50586_3]
MGPLTQTRYYRRIINGDACVLNNGNSVVTVSVFTISGTHVNNTCFGGNSGSIDLSISGNSGAVTYNWGGGIVSQDRTGLAAGTYTVTATAANGCTATATFTITQPNQITFTATPTNASCGANNGAINITSPTGGSGSGYTYSIGGAYQAGGSFTGLAGGIYTVSVKDGAGCIRSVQVTVGSVNTLTATAGTPTNVSCFGGNNGAVTINATGGTPSYQYQLGSGSFQSSSTFNGLTAGNYVITVRDANNCTTTVNVTIGGPAAALSATAGTPTNVLCFGGNNGAVTINATGGTPSYQYQLGSGSFQSSSTFNGLTAGSYVITVRDANNCTTTVNVTIGGPAAALSATAGTPTNVSCFGGNNGAVTINATGGTPSYQYQLGSGSFQSSSTFNGLTAGSYVITVRDANNCTATVNVTIGGPAAALSATAGTPTNVLCFGGNNGAVTINATGGTPSYQYQLGSGSFQSSSTFNGLTAGSYVITVRDANNCTTTVNVTIGGPAAALSATAGTPTNVSCFGGNNGAVTINATGGTPSYQYQLGSGSFQSSSTFNGLTAGNYVITVRDANNCTTTVNVTIGGPAAALSATAGTPTNVLCFGGNNGAVTINATGGTPSYQYQLGSGSFQSSSTFNGLTAGSYVITVRDANNCTTTVNVTIGGPAAALSGSIRSQTNVLCFGDATGSVTIDATGGTPGYTYQLGNGAFGNSNVFSGLTAGSYVVTVKDNNGCTTTVNVTITQPNAPLSASSSNQVNVLCYGNATGSFKVDVTGGTTGYTYQLDNGQFGNSNVFSGLTAGSYVVTVKDNNGCTTTVNVTITQPNAPLSASSSNQVNVLCYGNATGSFQVDVTGGTTGYTYQLGNGAFGNSNVFSGLVSGTYVVTVKDANGCTTTVSVTITQPNAPLSASSSNQVNVLCYGNATGSFQVDALGGTPGYTYQLDNGQFGNSNVFSGLTAGTYVVTVKDANGCTTTVNVTITQPNAPLSASSSNQVNVLCYGNATGSFQVDALGGTPGYTYQLDNGQFGNSNVFSGLTAGTYVVTVKDANGCTTTVNVTITQPNAPLSASSSNQVNVLCYGNATGSFKVDVTGGTTGYTYQLGNGAFGNSNVFSGLTAGSYVVTVKDANGCTTTVSVTITQPNAPLSASSSNQVNVLCYGNATGSFQVDALGGTPGYTYQLDNGQFGNSNVFSGLTAGTYVVTVKDNNGCTTAVSVTITQPNAPLSASSSNQGKCTLLRQCYRFIPG